MAEGFTVCTFDVGELGQCREMIEARGKISKLVSDRGLAADILHSLVKKELMAEVVEWSKHQVRRTCSTTNMAKKYEKVYQKAFG